ncbi:MAG: hypothetical protein IJJ33_17455 [Victivallales bacterium]|nr:hypothetical protein [Victivallales bacterium]
MTAVLLSCLVMATSVLAEGFSVRLGIDGGQVRELFLGVQEKATDGIDQDLDIMAPPFGMGSGIVGLVSDGQDPSLLYRDVRSPALPKTWRVSVAPARRPIVLTWKVADLPPNTVCQIENAGIRLDMRQCARLSIKNKTILSLTIAPQRKP